MYVHGALRALRVRHNRRRLVAVSIAASIAAIGGGLAISNQISSAATNLLSNPGCEAGTSYYKGYQSSLSTSSTIKRSGAAACKVSRTTGTMYTIESTQPFANPQKGQTFTGTAWVRADSNNGKQVALALRERGGSTSTRTVEGVKVTLSTAWQQVSNTITVQSSGRTALDFYLLQTSATSGNAFYADDLEFFVGTTPPPDPQDTTPPSVNLTSPANNATVSGTVGLAAEATDNVGVSSVQFKVNGANVGPADTSAPYTASWDTSAASNGTYTITATAFDAAGLSATSTETIVTLANQSPATPPTITITGPSDGATVSGSTSVFATASDDVGVTGVQFKLDGANLGPVLTDAPYFTVWDTTAVTNGNHVLTATATNGAGLSTTSTPVTVTVTNQTTTPPPSANNLLSNPGCETNTNYYKTYQGSLSRSTSVMRSGNAACKLTATSGSMYTVESTQSYANPQQGQIFSGSVWVRADTNSGKQVALVMRERGGSASTRAVEGPAVALSTTWQEVSNSITVQANGRTALDYYVLGKNSASGQSFYLDDLTFYTGSTPPPTNDAPVVSVTSPLSGSTVNGTVELTATASDDTGIATVQFKLDGTDLGPADTTAPYSFTWDTTTATDANHTLTAVATDTAGLTTTASYVTVTVQNGTNPPPTPTPLTDLRVSSNGRYLVKQDGTPFYWLGDTAWGIFGRLSRADITHYLTTRKQQGFTVIQMVVIKPSWNGVNSEGHNIGSLGNPNSQYFELVDYAINEAERLGLYTALWPIWSKDQHDRISTSNAQAYGQFLGNRYKDKPIIWVYGGDDSDERIDVWRLMAKGIAIGKTGSEDYSKMLMTYHPAGQQSSATTFHDDAWLDFNMVQTGHDSTQKKPYEMVTPDYARTPVKPVLDSEAMYEKHSDGWSDPDNIASAQLVRNYQYWSVFAGALGNTYGHWYIWPFVDATHIHPYSSIAKLRGDWKQDYLNDEVAGQIGNVRKLMESRPFQTGIPDQTVITSNAGSGKDRQQATRGSDGSYLMVYTPKGVGFSANLNKLSGTDVKAYWYDPRTGASTEIANVAKGSSVAFTPPSGGGDWVLVADDASRGYNAPGQ